MKLVSKIRRALASMVWDELATEWLALRRMTSQLETRVEYLEFKDKCITPSTFDTQVKAKWEEENLNGK